MWANEYVGMKFKAGGRDRKGLDCWGLYRLVVRERCGLELPAWDTVKADDYRTVGGILQVEAGKPEWHLVPPIAAKDCDCILMRGYVPGDAGLHVAPLHVGAFIRPSHCLHIEVATAAVCVPFEQIEWRLVGIYRHRDLE